MFYDFPQGFSASKTGGIRPISTHLKMVVDFCEWRDRLVLAADDASLFGNPLLGRPQSNLWFTTPDALRELGKPAGWGGPWVEERVRANEPSEAFLFAGFEHRIAHLSHDAKEPETFTFEVNTKGNGGWTGNTSITVPETGYAFHVFPNDVDAEWIRVRTDRNIDSATVYFHYSATGCEAEPAAFRSLVDADRPTPRSEGFLFAKNDPSLPLEFAANILDASGKIVERGYYVIGEEMHLRRVDDSDAEKRLRSRAATKQQFEVDSASVMMKDDAGNRYRLPKGADAFDTPSASGWPRAIREVVTERDLMNVHGTIYERPREASGGLAKIRPVCTHNRRIFDFASWRGMLVLSGNLTAAADDHYIPSDDGKAGLWFGNVDDLWKLGPPRGTGGPWRGTSVRAGAPSDPYLMTGYDRKMVELSHDQPGEVRFTIEVDFLANSKWRTYKALAVPSGKRLAHRFPPGFSAHWVRVSTDTDCRATATFVYESR
jgi:hypothetical protein